MDDFKKRIIELISQAQNDEKLELIYRFARRLLSKG